MNPGWSNHPGINHPPDTQAYIIRKPTFVHIVCASLLIISDLGCTGTNPDETTTDWLSTTTESNVLAPSVKLILPTEPIFAGTYLNVNVEIDPPGSIPFDDLTFEMKPEAGRVSYSRDDSFDPSNPQIMLLLGDEPGTHDVTIRDPNGTVMGIGIFEISDDWTDDELGPSVWMEGSPDYEETGSAIGEGPATMQNLDVFPRKGDWRVRVLFLDTKGVRYTSADLATLKTDWQNELSLVTDYFSEVSRNKLTIRPSIASKSINLPDSFDTYHQKTSKGWRRTPKATSTILAKIRTSGQYLSSYDSVILVMKSPDDKTKFTWPRATLGKNEIFFYDGLTENMGWYNLAIVSMPSNWPAYDGRSVHATLSHELLHNFRLSDQYTNGNPNTKENPRDIGDWDIMSWDGDLPHLTLAHKMMLGWADGIWPLNAATLPMGSQISTEIHPSSSEINPPLNRTDGVEYRVTSGQNLYFEYRRASGGLGDLKLPVNDRVLVTDVISYKSLRETSVERPAILVATEDPFGQRPFLASNDVYRILDRGIQPSLFEGHVTTIDVDAYGRPFADMTIDYGLVNAPDPSIRTGPDGQKKKNRSPDIEVINERNRQSAKWKNMPWRGHDNIVEATITNSGGIPADNVEVEVLTMDYTISKPPETSLGIRHVDIPPGESRTISVPWIPPKTGKHHCIKVKIHPYKSPVTGDIEINSENNVAQTNYTKFISASASPASRKVATLDITNPLTTDAVFYVTVQQSNPFYRTYLSNRWVRLAPNEVATVQAMFEYTLEDEVPRDTPYFRVANAVEIGGFIDPVDAVFDHPIYVGGADVEVDFGLATRFTEFNEDPGRPGSFLGKVAVTRTNSPPPPGGFILFTIESTSGQGVKRIEVDNEGRFKFDWGSSNWSEASAYYVAANGFADSESSVITP